MCLNICGYSFQMKFHASFQVFIYIMLVVKCLQNVSVTALFLYRAGTVITTMVFIPLLCVRFHLAAVLRSSTTRNLQPSSARVLIMDSKLCMNLQKCAQFVWVLWKAGVPSITVRTWQARRVGLRYISMGRYSGLIKFSLRWARPIMQYHLCHDFQRKNDLLHHGDIQSKFFKKMCIDMH